jgi:dTDP-4-amino-4,6-dideoxygalactose transaminase
MNDKNNIFVTQPFLPPLSELYEYLEKIWENKVLTNGGPFHQQLEEELCHFLGVKYISLFSNGTLALLTALQVLGIKGEVITTPFSFVATSHSLLWNGLTPVFVDIDPDTFNIDPEKIEAAVTSQTTAILPVHCYGQPCDTESIQMIADKHNLKVIYDAAHAFGVRHNDTSILNYGDLSVLSFHATKVFNTFEGGAIVCDNLKTKQYIDQLKNFGFVDEVTVLEAGINGKMSELNASVGLVQLKYIQEALHCREKVDEIYRQGLLDVEGVVVPRCNINSTRNYSYFPILINSDFHISRDELYEELKSNGIFSRRYFYPLISSFPMYSDLLSALPSNLPVATDISNRVLCLPIHPYLSESDQRRIIQIVKEK